VYGITRDAQVDDNTLDFRTVANDLRKVANQSYRANIATAMIAKGAFGPTFAGEEGQHGRSEECSEDTNGGKATGERKRG
jgi:hypothetical protein